MESRKIAPESEARRLLQIGLGDDDLVVRRTSPMNSAGIDHNWKLVRPRPRQLTSKKLLANRCDRHVDAESCRRHSRVGARGDDIYRTWLHFLNFTRNVPRA